MTPDGPAEPTPATPPRTTARCPRTGKLAHPTHAAAVKALEGHRTFVRYKGGGYTADGVVQVFKCKFCSSFHLGGKTDTSRAVEADLKARKRARQDRLRELREREAEEDTPC